MTTMRAMMNEINVIEVELARSFYEGLSNAFYLRDIHHQTSKLEILSSKKEEDKVIYRLSAKNIHIGEEYHILDDHNMSVILEFQFVVKSPEFDELFYYDGEDLGPTYHRDHTVFKVWAPIATQVFVQLKENTNLEMVQMTRVDKGVYTCTIHKDLDGIYYQYLLCVNGQYQTSIDPYAYTSSPNHEYSCVIDLEKTKVDLHKDQIPQIHQYNEAILYELSVRDFSYDPYGGMKNRSKFLAFEESGTKTDKGYATGIDYLSSLGVTHLQIMPFYDFGSVDETNQFLKYNWGYDPVQYNVPEGSYATDVFDPYARVIECKRMIAAIHQHGMRVNMDVVYNHVFDRMTSSFEKLVPIYYFRFGKNGEVSNGSYCGNDFDSTRKMASKFIIDSVKRWMSFYGVDGFRFDLMGIIDMDTMKKVVAVSKSIDASAMIYGEGWDMPTIMNDDLKSALKNQGKLPLVGHFNDRFREIVKGSTWHDELAKKGYAGGKTSLVEPFVNAMLGSCTTIGGSVYVSEASKSINYVACHDNTTLFDKLSFSNKEESEEIRKKRQRMIFAIVLLSQGVPFIHAGQEFFRTKNGEHNSYISSDSINQIDWKRMENHFDSVLFAKDVIAFRKAHKIFYLNEPEEIAKRYSYQVMDDDVLVITIDCHDYESDFKTMKLIINVSTKVKCCSLDDYYKVLFNEFGLIQLEMYSQHLMINPVSLMVLAK